MDNNEKERLTMWVEGIWWESNGYTTVQLTNAWVNGVNYDDVLAWDFYPDLLDTDTEFERYWTAVFNTIQGIRVQKDKEFSSKILKAWNEQEG